MVALAAVGVALVVLAGYFVVMLLGFGFRSADLRQPAQGTRARLERALFAPYVRDTREYERF